MLGTVYKMSDACISSELWVGGEVKRGQTLRELTMKLIMRFTVAYMNIFLPTRGRNKVY